MTSSAQARSRKDAEPRAGGRLRAVFSGVLDTSAGNGRITPIEGSRSDLWFLALHAMNLFVTLAAGLASFLIVEKPLWPSRTPAAKDSASGPARTGAAILDAKAVGS